MTTLQVVSDLHLEFFRDGGADMLSRHAWPQADALFLAGDIGVARNAWTLTESFKFWRQRYPQVFYVPGNHEFYKDMVKPALRTLHEVCEQQGVVFLEPGVTGFVNDRRVLGGTLWFPKQPDNKDYESEINDFGLIKHFVPWVYDENARHVAWLTQEMKAGDIVMSHHLPSPQSVAPAYKDSALNRFFVCDMEKLIVERQPALWLHGHTHNSMDYRIGATRVRANPRGYPTTALSENRGYAENCTITLPSGA